MTSRNLSAVDVLHPGPAEAVVVLAGEVLVFAELSDGRRIPVSTVEAGAALVGCAPNADARMLAVGVVGTTINACAVGDLDQAQMLTWVGGLGSLVAGGRWPSRLLPVSQAGSMVSPGEHIGEVGTTWVRLTSGHATWCANPGAALRRDMSRVVLPPGTWLTAGLRARVVHAQAPADAREWAEALDAAGQLALGAVVAQRRARDAEAAERIEHRGQSSAVAAQEAVDVLAAAVGGVRRIPRLADVGRAEALAAAVMLAEASGLQLQDQGVQKAASEVEAGRDPLTAIAAMCEARPSELRLRTDWWQREGAPLLVRFTPRGRSQSRAAVAVWSGNWELRDPVQSEVAEVDEELAGRIELDAFELRRVLPAQPLSLRSLAQLAFKGSRRELAIILGLTTILAMLAFVTPYALGQLSSVFLSQSPDAAFAGLFGALLLVVVAGTSFQAVRALSMLRARSSAAAVSATALWERVMRQRANWHAQRSLGDRLNQASAVNNASAAMPDQTVALVLDVSFVLGSLAAIATTNAVMLLALGALLMVQLLVTTFILRASTRLAEQRFVASAAASTMLMETFAAVNRLRVAGAESRAYMRWARVQAPFIRADQSLRRMAMVQGVLVAVWPLLTLVVIVAVTALSGASFGDFVTAQTAAGGATAAISAMTGAASAALVARQSLRQAKPALATVPEGGPEGVTPGVISGGLEARDLVFRYGPDLPPVLDHVNISVKPGEQVAVVGPSGCGKTTLMRVLLGLEDPDSGVIAVDGRDLASLNRPAVRRQIGSVLQSSSLLPGSIKDNIDMGRGLTQAQIWAALEAADLVQDVRAMAMGIETLVTDGGGTISGGQRQRVLIARALAGSPRMLILDEATSALDNVTQSAVVESLARLRITRLVVAHRLSTIRDADRIIVMDAGRVVEEGSFDELVAAGGVFAELVARQSL